MGRNIIVYHACQSTRISVRRFVSFYPSENKPNFRVFFLIKELRYYAYLAGNIRPPASVVMDPFIQLVKDTPEATPFIEDQLQSISAQTQYDKHSHEVRSLNFLFDKLNFLNLRFFCHPLSKLYISAIFQ